ncbi:MAG: hypothetical protein ACXWT1_16440 [Methylobacter sp.]
MNKPEGSKLFKLKEWLTLPDAAKHLSGVCNEEVTEADILRLALDGHLKLSVNFVNYTKARCGNIVSYEDVEWIEIPLKNELPIKNVETGDELPAYSSYHSPHFLVEEEGKPSHYKYCERIDDTRFLNLSDEVTTIKDVWDLPMISCERLDIEHKYQELTGGPAVTLQNLGGALVEGRDGVMCQLQEKFKDSDFHKVHGDFEERIKQRIADNNLWGVAKEKALVFLEALGNKSFKNKVSYFNPDDYYPADGLPQDSVLVIRTCALTEFERLIGDNEEINTSTSNNPNNSDLTETERQKMLKLIIGMAIDAYGYNPESNRNSATGDKNGISAKLQTHGISIIDDTIRKYLTEAKKLI